MIIIFTSNWIISVINVSNVNKMKEILLIPIGLFVHTNKTVAERHYSRKNSKSILYEQGIYMWQIKRFSADFVFI